MKVLATGVFDLFHVGHLRYLQYARAQGDHLSVAVTPDALALERKKKRPSIDQTQRLEIVRGLACVAWADYMPSSLEEVAQATAWICAWGIETVVVGGEWQGSARWQRLTPALAQHGIAVCFAPHTTGISSTQIVERIVERYRHQITTGTP